MHCRHGIVFSMKAESFNSRGDRCITALAPGKSRHSSKNEIEAAGLAVLFRSFYGIIAKLLVQLAQKIGRRFRN